MALNGKGFWIWKIKSCEGGVATAIADVALAASLTHVPIKIADGPYQYNYDRVAKVDLIAPVREALKLKNILVWGWHYVYGYDPIGEANIAIQQIQRLGLDGYIIDAEAEYKESGKTAAAQTIHERPARRPADPAHRSIQLPLPHLPQDPALVDLPGKMQLQHAASVLGRGAQSGRHSLPGVSTSSKRSAPTARSSRPDRPTRPVTGSRTITTSSASWIPPRGSG